VLNRLNIRDFVIVDRLELEFDKGFSVLSGETGAGKSIMIDALSMVLGERADASLVRQGCGKAEVSAEFIVSRNGPVREVLEQADLVEDDVCLLRRVIDASGRTRAWVNGRPATVQQLRSLAEHLVDIHGQHEHQSLSRPLAQRALLDAYAGTTQMARKVHEAWQEWQSVRKMRVAAEADAESIGREREQLEWQIGELENLAFSEEEWHAVSAEQTRLAHTASLVEAAEFAMQALSESETAALAAVSSVQSRLSALIEYDPGLREILELVEPAQIQLQEAVYSLRHYQQRLDVDPQRLSEVEARLGAIHTAARKYRTTPERLSAVLEQAKKRLDELDTNLDAKALERRESEKRAACEKIARKLSSAREKAARQLSGKVTHSMQTLAMHGGAFEVALTSLDECASHGLEQVEFRVAGHAGTRPRALAKVASGGELSRISLAIETATSEVAQVPTLIFDEVDVGIGGGVAEIVGRMLSDLGARHQVMCVTHLPQVAASADQQWQVSKHMRNGSAISTVIRLEEQQRVEEIARMLGGVRITETTRKHAAELLHHSE